MNMIIFILILLCSQQLNAQLLTTQLLTTDSHLIVENIEVVERRDQFSLEISFKKTEKANLLLNLFDYNDKGTEPATIDIDENQARAAIKITPEIPFTLSGSSRGLILLGNFTPETNYNLHISKQLKDITGSSLKEALSRSFYIGNFQPQFNFLNKSRFIPPNLQENISYETINLSQVEVTIRQIYPQNIHQLLSSRDNVSNNLSDIIKTDKINIKNQKDKKIKGVLSLESLRPLGQGIFYLEARTDKLKLDSTIVVVTELGATMKLGENQSLRIWTFKNTSLKPLQDVEVTLTSESNYKMGQCSSQGPRGYCEIKWTDKSRIPFAVTLKKGIDQHSLRLSDLILSNEELQNGKRNYFLKDQPYDAFIYSARNLYRAGETIHFAAQVRSHKFESIKTLPLTWKFFNPEGNQYKEFITKTSEFGTALLNLPTHLLYTEGTYSVEVYADNALLNSYRFHVENYAPERFMIKLNPKKELIIGENKVRFDIQTHNLLGTQPIKAQFTADCALTEAFHNIPNHPEYNTGTYKLNGKKPVTIDRLSGTITNGDSSYLCDFSQILSNLPKTIYKADSKVYVSELSSPIQITETASTFLSSTNSNLGIKAQQNPENNSVHIEGLILDLDGNILNENHKISVELLQIQTNWINFEQNSTGSKTQWKAIETLNPKSITKTVEAQAGAFQVKLTPPLDWRKWIVRATDLQTKMIAELPLDSLLTISENTKFENIEIKSNKNELLPGEKFKVTILPPFRGELLIGIESFKVIEQQWLHVDKLEPIELEFKAPEVSPNFYVTALLLKEPISNTNKLITNRAWAAKSLQMIPQKNTLNIQITAPSSRESLSELTVKIANKEKTTAEYNIAIVDEELWTSSQFKSPNPLLHFFDARKLNTQTFESLDSAISNEEVTAIHTDKTKIIGTLNKKNKNLVQFWFPNIKSDKNGKSELRIKIPNFLGKLKIHVIGSARNLCGGNETTVEVKDSLSIQTLLPEFVTTNDKIDLNFKMRNSSKIDEEITLSLGTTGPIQVEKIRFNELVKADGENQLNHELKVLDFPNPIKLEINAEHKNSRKNWQETIELPTYSNGIEQFLQFDTPADKRLDLITALPPIWKKNYLKIHLSLSNISFIGAFSHLSTLWNYPYNNLEQIVSKILPLIANNDLLSLAEGIDPTVLAQTVHAKIQNSLEQIMSQQTLDGGFALWPSDAKSHPWASAFATLALSEARDQGYTVSSHILNKALSYLQNSVLSDITDWQWYENENPALSLALYVLAKNKKNISHELISLSKNIEQLKQKTSEAFGYENLFLLAITAKLTKNNSLLNKIINDKILERKIFSNVFYEKSFSANSFWSSMRMDGLRLNMLLEHWPEHKAIKILSQRIAERLALPKTFFSSQDLSWPLLALSKQLLKYKIDPQALKNVKLQMSNKDYLPNFQVRGIPVWHYSGDELISSSFKFPELQKTKLRFHTKVSGFTMSPPPSLSPINVVRAYLLPDGSEADETELKIGQQVLVELRIFNPRSIHFRSVALVDRLPAGLVIDSANAYSENITWMNKNIFSVKHYDTVENQLQIYGDLTETERYYYYQVRAVSSGKFKSPSAKVELMYIPESFDFSSEATVGVSP